MNEFDWTSVFTGLACLSPAILDELRADGQIVTLEVGTRVFGPGKSPTHYLMLLEGTIRVSQISEQGREIVLYRVSAGESCALTTACLMGFEDYLAEGTVEEASRAVAIPRALFDSLIARSPEFRRFVFTAFSTRVTDLFRVIEEVAFERIDIRLAQHLLKLANGGGQIRLTHQELATELGSAREVVSRQLKEFQRRNWVTLSRGSVEIRDEEAVRTLAGQR